MIGFWLSTKAESGKVGGCDVVALVLRSIYLALLETQAVIGRWCSIHSSKFLHVYA